MDSQWLVQEFNLAAYSITFGENSASPTCKGIVLEPKECTAGGPERTEAEFNKSLLN